MRNLRRDMPGKLREEIMSAVGTVGSSPWYRSLDRSQWKALIAANLGWTFDGFEVFALILTVGVALHQLLEPSQYPLIPAYAGAVIAIMAPRTIAGFGDSALAERTSAGLVAR